MCTTWVPRISWQNRIHHDASADVACCFSLAINVCQQETWMEVSVTCARLARTALATMAASPAPPAALASQGQQGQLIPPSAQLAPRPVQMAKGLLEKHRTLAQI
jgi:hypothetical protein